MRTTTIALAALLVGSAGAEAATLFRTPTRTTWSVTQDGRANGTIQLATSGTMARADWSPAQGAAVTMIARDGKIWVRTSDGDVELADARNAAGAFLPALLLPATPSSRDRAEETGGHVSSYTFGSSAATYTWDANAPSSVAVRTGSNQWQLQRTALNAGSIAAATFEVRAKQGRGSRLASMAGGLLGTSNREVSPTAGVSGVDPKGIKLQDGGDWAALEKAEQLKQKFADDEDALEDFQKSGGVGPAGGNR